MFGGRDCVHDDGASGCCGLCLYDEFGVDHRLEVDFVVACGHDGLGKARGGQRERDDGGSEHD